MAMVRRREPPKTWSLLGDVRRKPTEYEVVTAKLHYHFRRQPAPFELDPNTPLNTWYLRYREGSPLQANSWEGFRDPHQLTYQAYVQRQAVRETYLENLVDEFERRNYDAALQRDWINLLDRLYVPARFPMHALQMTSLYIGQMAPSSFITNAAFFQAADEQRRIQWLAYRAKSLSLEHDTELASSAHTRRRWEDDAVWQPLREAVEKMLIAYDWGEAFTALNLVVKPVFDELLNMQLAELARVHEDVLLGLMLDDFAIEIQRCRDCSVALVQYATAQRGANTELLKEWVDRWKPLAYRSMEGVLELFGQAPRALEPRVVATEVRAAHDAFLARCGLDATPMPKAESQESAIDAIGDMVAWGAHFCLFYETKADLLDALISYCKSGLENKEYCLWVVTEPLTIEEAKAALKQAVLDCDRYLVDGCLEIVSANDFFLKDGKFDRKRVAEAMLAKIAGMSAKGYGGVRLTGDTSWVTKKDWIPFCELEDGINDVIGNQRLAVLCTYSLAACGANEILDAVRTHQFALARRQGSWVVIETAAVKRAKAEIKRLNEELEQRVAERTSELVKAEQRYRVMIETASDAVVCTDESGIVRVANLATMRVFGYEPAELIGKPLTVLMPEPLRKAHEDGFKRYLATGQRHLNWQGTELTGLRKNGQEFPVEISFGEVTADGHRIFTSFIRDISKKKKTERALRRSEAYLAEAQRVSHTGSWHWDVATAELIWSQEFFAIFGFDPEQTKPSYPLYLERIHPDDRSRVEKTRWKAVREKRDFDLEYRLLLPSGVIKYVHSMGRCSADQSGNVEYTGAIVDITGRKRAEEERERLRRVQAELAHINRVSTMGELTASLAHEIKQPIGAAVTNAEASLRLLNRNHPDIAEAREAALEMVKDATRAADIIDRVRALYQKGSSQPEIIEVNEIIGEMVAMLQNEAHRHSVTIRTDLAGELPAVMADRVQLQQVLMNLMLNGIEAMREESGELSIKSQLAEDGQLLISVIDTGVGLPTENADQIYNPFFTTKSQGTGLGLAITRSIIESHGGRIWATRNSGRGATFHFTLPASVAVAV